MAEKLFVIAEIKHFEGNAVTGFCTYTLSDGRGVLTLPPDAVIPATRLRYGQIESGDIFWGASGGWVKAEKNQFAKLPSIEQYLVLDPPATMDDWDAWIEDMPHPVNTREDWQRWYRRMPRGK